MRRLKPKFKAHMLELYLAEKHYSYDDLGRIIGTGAPAICRCVTGRNIPSIGTALALAKEMGVKVEDLFEI